MASLATYLCHRYLVFYYFIFVVCLCKSATATHDGCIKFVTPHASKREISAK